MASDFDDLFPGAAEASLGTLAPMSDEDWRAARRQARLADKARPLDASGAPRVKRGRRRLSAAETRVLTNRLARALPLALAADRRLTPGDVRVLAVLVIACRRAKTHTTDMSVPEIANRAAVSARQVQLSAEKLGAEPFSLLTRAFRVLRPGMNDTNVYRLAETCFMRKTAGTRAAAKARAKQPKRRRETSSGQQDYVSVKAEASGAAGASPYSPARPGAGSGSRAEADANSSEFSGQGPDTGGGPSGGVSRGSPSVSVARRARFARGGEKLSGLKNTLFERYTPTSTSHNSETNNQGCRKRSANDYSENRSGLNANITQNRKIPIPDISNDHASLMKRALAVIGTEKELPDRPDRIVEAVERLRLTYINGFDHSAWPMLVRKHGVNAYLAVIETLLIASVRAGTERVLHSLPAYLGGILWKKQPINPEHTVNQIIQLYGQNIEPRKAA